ncbi:MAG: S-layer homology domain-containing protein [Oscillospiraceae bacterium]|nr:S-layer homology domain-containing protein [Oscillospiraceae bacterium]
MFTFAAMATAAEVKYDDLTDTASIEHVEAVQVLTGLGVIQGFEDKTFKPAESVTRVQMAKMVGFIMNDGDDINDLYKAACPFADSKSNWGAGYIAYCATQGIVNGRNATTFDPNATVTGAEAAKMLLCAMGYDATIEGFVGADWSVNVLNVAKKAGLLKELSAGKMGAALNREDAAQMIFNALKAEEVEYDTKGTTVSINGATIATGASKATTVETNHKTFAGDEVKAPLLWGEDHFIDGEDSAKQLKLKKVTDDPFGIVSNAWYYGKDSDNKDVEISKDLKLAKTFVGSMTAADLYALTGKIDKDTDDIIIKVDGADPKNANYKLGKVTIDGVARDAKAADWADGTVLNETTSTQRNNNKFKADEIEVYVNDKAVGEGRTIQIIGKSYFLGTVTKYYAAKTTAEHDYILIDGKEFKTTAFSKADEEDETKVVYTFADGEVQSAKKAEIVKSGEVTKIDEDSDENTVFTADGKTYTCKGKNADVKIDAEYDLYLDPNGKVLGVEETKSGSSNYFMVMKKAYVENSGLDAADTVYSVRLLGTDGKTIDLNVAKLDGVKTTETGFDWDALTAVENEKFKIDEDTEISACKVGTIVTYTLNNKGEAELTTTSADFASASKEINIKSYENLTNIANELTAMKANSDTKFVLISLDSKGNLVYTPVSGIAAMKAVTGNYNFYNNVTVEVKSSGSKTIDVAGVAFIFVDARNVTSTKTVFTTLGVSKVKTVSLTGKTPFSYYEVNAIEGSEIKTLKVKAAAYDTVDDAKFTLASSYSVDEDGFVDKITVANANFKDSVDSEELGYKGGVLTIGTNEFTQDNVKVFLYDAEADEFTSQNVSKDMKDDIVKGLFFYYNTTSDTTKTVVAIFGEAE